MQLVSGEMQAFCRGIYAKQSRLCLKLLQDADHSAASLHVAKTWSGSATKSQHVGKPLRGNMVLSIELAKGADCAAIAGMYPVQVLFSQVMPRQVVAVYHMNLQSHQSPLQAVGSDHEDQKATSDHTATSADCDAALRCFHGSLPQSCSHNGISRP